MKRTDKETQSKLGFAFLGSGGGGSIQLGKMLLAYLARQSLSYQLVKSDHIQDDHNLVFMAFVGPPSIANEKLPSTQGGLTAIHKVEERLGEKVHGIVTMEIGGTNGMYGLFLSAISQQSHSPKYVVDADAMGRAYPSASLVTPLIFESDQYFPLTITLSTDTFAEDVVVQHIDELDDTWINWTMEHGGIATLALLTLKGHQVKTLIREQHLINNSISSAFNVGTILENFRMGNITRLSEFEERLKTCDAPYHNIRLLLDGKITKIKAYKPSSAQRDQKATLDEGLITLRDSKDNQKEYIVVYKNEYLGIYDVLKQTYLATTPTIIAIMDTDLTPITADCVAEGQKVKVMALDMQHSMTTALALQKIGPQSEVFGLFHESLMDEFAEAHEKLLAQNRTITTTFFAPMISPKRQSVTPSERFTPLLSTNTLDDDVSSPISLSIDVGGTHTDVILHNENHIIHGIKSKTLPDDLCTSIQNAVEHLFSDKTIQHLKKKVSRVNVGTTTFVNAFLKAKNIETVLPIRIASPFGDFHPPLTDWPTDIQEAIGGEYLLVQGSVNYKGVVEQELDLDKITTDLLNLFDQSKTDYQNIVINCMNAPLNPALEHILKNHLEKDPRIKQRIFCSHIIPCTGIIERENSTILNTALQAQYQHLVSDIKQAMTRLGIPAERLYMSRNDGTTSTPEATLPILTFKSGPSNSIRGVAALEKEIKNAIIIDIGGTTSDCGAYQDGYPICSSLTQDIFGIPCRLTGPVVNSIEMGGESAIHTDPPNQAVVRIGGARTNNLQRSSQPITLTDLAIARGYMTIEGREAPFYISEATLSSGLELAHRQWAEQIEKLIPELRDDEPFDVIIVGGGANLCHIETLKTHLAQLKCDAKIRHVRNLSHWGGFANAIGAGVANIQCKGTLRIEQSNAANKTIIVNALIEKLKKQAIEIGADPASLECFNKEICQAYEKETVTEMTITVKGKPAHQFFGKDVAQKKLSFTDASETSPRKRRSGSPTQSGLFTPRNDVGEAPKNASGTQFQSRGN